MGKDEDVEQALKKSSHLTVASQHQTTRLVYKI